MLNIIMKTSKVIIDVAKLGKFIAKCLKGLRLHVCGSTLVYFKAFKSRRIWEGKFNVAEQRCIWNFAL